MNWRRKWAVIVLPLALVGWGCAGSARAPTAATTAHVQSGEIFDGSARGGDFLYATSREADVVAGSPVARGDVSISAELHTDDGHRLIAEATPEENSTPPAAQAGSDADPPDEQAVSDTPGSGPLLIYTADLNLAVHEVREKIDAAIAISDEVGGFLQAQNDTSVIIRVPAARFRDALSRVEALGDVLHRRVAAQDVSEQVRDIRIRLQNAVQMRDRLAELLERAETVPESLTIERELERLTQTIEQLRGQLRSFDDQIAYSTITIRFAAIRVDSEVPRERFRLPFPWLNELGLVNLLRL